LALQCLSKEALGGAGITSSLHEDVDHITILIDGSPNIVDLPADGDEDFVDMPGVVELAFSALEPSAETGTELQTPSANRLVRYLNTPLGKEIFNISEAQVESMIQPDGVADDFGRKPVAMISRFGLAHPLSVPNIGLK
jgi:hypothetical protein